jgi:hypothetical protein
MGYDALCKRVKKHYEQDILFVFCDKNDKQKNKVCPPAILTKQALMAHIF